MTETARPDLDARYGRTPGSRRWGRIAGWAAGAGIVAVFSAWLLWAGPFSASGPAFEATDLGFDLVDDSQIIVHWQFTIEPGTAASCALQAQNDVHAIVGWTVVELPEAQERTRRYSQQVLTTERAVTGLIYRCWLA